ncbi:MAG: OmpA family protein, partial [Clostridiales bacterium]|nr:OmpA family protein [Clostridiales bacterium]
EQAALLAAQQAQIDKLVGLRSQIIEDLRDNLSNVGQRVTVDRKTGAVTFESSVLFDTGKNEIKDAGKAALNSCIPVYIHTLLSDEYRDYVGEIIVEGHTDTTGQYLNNLALSQQRALAVATYCLSDEMTGLSDADKETFKSILTANGRADADPIYNADGTVNMDASRRVVIKFRMKDSDMIDQMSAILEGSAQGE